MGERGEVSQYAYWSERAVRRTAQDMAVDLDPRWRTKVLVAKIPFIPVGVDIERQPRTLFRTEIADRIERAIGDNAVEDLVTPPPVRFAKGIGSFVFSHFISEERGRVVLYTKTVASNGTRVGVVLFGSRDNLPGWVGPEDPQTGGWTSSARWGVVEWLQSECRLNSSQWDDF